MNRKQRRQLNKVAGKEATSTIDLMLNMPSECSKCSAAYDKTSREMALSWFVEVYSSQKKVTLTCPDCHNNE